MDVLRMTCLPRLRKQREKESPQAPHFPSCQPLSGESTILHSTPPATSSEAESHRTKQKTATAIVCSPRNQNALFSLRFRSPGEASQAAESALSARESIQEQPEVCRISKKKMGNIFKTQSNLERECSRRKTLADPSVPPFVAENTKKLANEESSLVHTCSGLPKCTLSEEIIACVRRSQTFLSQRGGEFDSSINTVLRFLKSDELQSAVARWLCTTQNTVKNDDTMDNKVESARTVVNYWSQSSSMTTIRPFAKDFPNLFSTEFLKSRPSLMSLHQPARTSPTHVPVRCMSSRSSAMYSCRASQTSPQPIAARSRKCQTSPSRSNETPKTSLLQKIYSRCKAYRHRSVPRVASKHSQTRLKSTHSSSDNRHRRLVGFYGHRSSIIFEKRDFGKEFCKMDSGTSLEKQVHYTAPHLQLQIDTPEQSETGLPSSSSPTQSSSSSRSVSTCRSPTRAPSGQLGTPHAFQASSPLRFQPSDPSPCASPSTPGVSLPLLESSSSTSQSSDRALSPGNVPYHLTELDEESLQLKHLIRKKKVSKRRLQRPESLLRGTPPVRINVVTETRHQQKAEERKRRTVGNIESNSFLLQQEPQAKENSSHPEKRAHHENVKPTFHNKITGTSASRHVRNEIEHEEVRDIDWQGKEISNLGEKQTSDSKEERQDDASEICKEQLKVENNPDKTLVGKVKKSRVERDESRCLLLCALRNSRKRKPIPPESVSGSDDSDTLRAVSGPAQETVRKKGRGSEGAAVALKDVDDCKMTSANADAGADTTLYPEIPSSDCLLPMSESFFNQRSVSASIVTFPREKPRRECCCSCLRKNEETSEVYELANSEEEQSVVFNVPIHASSGSEGHMDLSKSCNSTSSLHAKTSHSNFIKNVSTTYLDTSTSCGNYDIPMDAYPSFTSKTAGNCTSRDSVHGYSGGIFFVTDIKAGDNVCYASKYTYEYSKFPKGSSPSQTGRSVDHSTFYGLGDGPREGCWEFNSAYPNKSKSGTSFCGGSCINWQLFSDNDAPSFSEGTCKDGLDYDSKDEPTMPNNESHYSQPSSIDDSHSTSMTQNTCVLDESPVLPPTDVSPKAQDTCLQKRGSSDAMSLQKKPTDHSMQKSSSNIFLKSTSSASDSMQNQCPLSIIAPKRVSTQDMPGDIPRPSLEISKSSHSAKDPRESHPILAADEANFSEDFGEDDLGDYPRPCYGPSRWSACPDMPITLSAHKANKSSSRFGVALDTPLDDSFLTDDTFRHFPVPLNLTCFNSTSEHGIPGDCKPSSNVMFPSPFYKSNFFAEDQRSSQRNTTSNLTSSNSLGVGRTPSKEGNSFSLTDPMNGHCPLQNVDKSSFGMSTREIQHPVEKSSKYKPARTTVGSLVRDASVFSLRMSGGGSSILPHGRATRGGGFPAARQFLADAAARSTAFENNVSPAVKYDMTPSYAARGMRGGFEGGVPAYGGGFVSGGRAYGAGGGGGRPHCGGGFAAGGYGGTGGHGCGGGFPPYGGGPPPGRGGGGYGGGGCTPSREPPIYVTHRSKCFHCGNEQQFQRGIPNCQIPLSCPPPEPPLRLMADLGPMQGPCGTAPFAPPPFKPCIGPPTPIGDPVGPCPAHGAVRSRPRVTPCPEWMSCSQYEAPYYSQNYMTGGGDITTCGQIPMAYGPDSCQVQFNYDMPLISSLNTKSIPIDFFRSDGTACVNFCI